MCSTLYSLLHLSSRAHSGGGFACGREEAEPLPCNIRDGGKRHCLRQYAWRRAGQARIPSARNLILKPSRQHAAQAALKHYLPWLDGAAQRPGGIFCQRSLLGSAHRRPPSAAAGRTGLAEPNWRLAHLTATALTNAALAEQRADRAWLASCMGSAVLPSPAPAYG